MNYMYKKKEARAIGKSILTNIPPPTSEKSGLELGLAQGACLPGNLAARQTDRQRASLSGNRGKRYLSKGISRENLEAAGTPGEKVVSRSYQPYFLNIFHLT
jgi:hypothetical protein